MVVVWTTTRRHLNAEKYKIYYYLHLFLWRLIRRVRTGRFPIGDVSLHAHHTLQVTTIHGIHATSSFQTICNMALHALQLASTHMPEK